MKHDLRRFLPALAVVAATALLAHGSAFARAHPDVIVDPGSASGYWTTGVRFFPPGHCALQEQCIGAAGWRTLLSFRVQTANLAQADLALGDPTNDPRFHFDSCHGHFHLENFSDYSLRPPGGGAVASGHKQGWCLQDSTQYIFAPWVPLLEQFDSCLNQGITRGWSDIYYEGYDCQWIDVTGLAPGSYDLSLTVNAGNLFQEADTSNNTTTVPVVVDSMNGPPDLIPEMTQTPASLRSVTRFVLQADQGILDGCIGATGYRKLLNLQSRMANVGQYDLVLGEPGYSPLFVSPPGHGHWHVPGLYRFDLVDGAGASLAASRLETLLPTDYEQHVSAPWVRGASFYEQNGLQRGWRAFSSTAGSSCSYIDVTDVPNGDYTLRVTVDADNIIPESDESNNSAEIPASVVESSGGLPHRPDGHFVAGLPLDVDRVAGTFNDVRITYDTQACPAAGYSLLYSLRPPGQYQYDGGVCGLTNSGTATFSLPNPAPGGLLWFLIVGKSGAVEGGHGFDSEGRIRPLRGIGPLGYMCSVTRSEPREGCIQFVQAPDPDAARSSPQAGEKPRKAP